MNNKKRIILETRAIKEGNCLISYPHFLTQIYVTDIFMYSTLPWCTLLKKIKGTWSAPSLVHVHVCGHSQVQLLEDMHNCTSLKSLMFNPFASEAVYTRNFKHAFRFLRVLPEAVSTRHSWLWQTLDDVYTRRCFSESEGTRFGAPGQKALPSVNEFTLLWIFARHKFVKTDL